MTEEKQTEKKIVRPLTPEALEKVDLMYGEVVVLGTEKNAELPTRRRSQKHEWISPESFRAFIVEQLQANDGHMEEDNLDRILRDRYLAALGKRDVRIIPKRHIPQWKQNVAAAKATLYKLGIACTARLKEGRRKITHRVLMDPTTTPEEWLDDAMTEWTERFEKKTKKKKRYKKKKHPTDRTVF